MDFPLSERMDEQACYDKLLRARCPEGVVCPHCDSAEHRVHRYARRPVLDYRCHGCGAVFNIFTGTALQGARRSPAQIMPILRGMAQGVTTARMAREMGVSRPRLLELRHKLQSLALEARAREPLPDAVAEADEMFQNAGEKRCGAPGSRGSAASPGEQAQGPWDVGSRSAADSRRRRPRQGAASPHGPGPHHPGGVGARSA